MRAIPAIAGQERGGQAGGMVAEELRSNWSWSQQPAAWCFTAGGGLRMEAPGGSDLFHMPGVRELDLLPAFERQLETDFTLGVDVLVEGEAFADAAGVVVRVGSEWLKVCVERLRGGAWAVVTVFSVRGSDEACGPRLVAGNTRLLLTRQGSRFAVFHARAEGGDWEFVRTCWWEVPASLRVGLFAQAPFSKKCLAEFSDVQLSPTPMRDRR